MLSRGGGPLVERRCLPPDEDGTVGTGADDDAKVGAEADTCDDACVAQADVARHALLVPPQLQHLVAASCREVLAVSCDVQCVQRRRTRTLHLSYQRPVKHLNRQVISISKH